MRKDVLRLIPLLAACSLVVAPVVGGLSCDTWEEHRHQRERARLKQLAERIKQSPADTAALEELAAYQDHSESWDRCVAFVVIREVGPAVRDDPGAGAVFERVLLPVIRRGLQDPSGAVRQEAARAAGAFGRLALPAVPDLIRAMREAPGDLTALNAAESVGAIGPEAREAIPAVEAVGQVYGEHAIRVPLEQLRGRTAVAK
jgi:HEAT repeat protein